MREIEFRVWNKQEHVMMYSDIEIFDDMIGFRFGHFSIDQEFELMQYTGVKDKNGNKIFEGDLITNESELKWLVVWDEYYAAFRLRNVRHPDMDTMQIRKDWLDEFNAYIIGNIHDNPELSEAKK